MCESARYECTYCSAVHIDTQLNKCVRRDIDADSKNHAETYHSLSPYIYIYTYMCVSYVYIHRYVFMHLCIHTYIYIYIYVYIYMHIHTCLYSHKLVLL